MVVGRAPGQWVNMTISMLAMILVTGFVLPVAGPPICETLLKDSLVREEAGEETSFQLSCTNWMWGKFERNLDVLVVLDPVSELKICVDGGDDSCSPEEESTKVNMTRRQQNYTVKLLAEDEGIKCIKLASFYIVGNELLDPEAAELHLTNGIDEDLEKVDDIPDEYTHVFELEIDADPTGRRLEGRQKNKSQDRADWYFEPEEVSMANATTIEESYNKVLKDKGKLQEEVSVLTKAHVSTLLERGNHFSRILLLIGDQR